VLKLNLVHSLRQIMMKRKLEEVGFGQASLYGEQQQHSILDALLAAAPIGASDSAAPLRWSAMTEAAAPLHFHGVKVRI